MWTMWTTCLWPIASLTAPRNRVRVWPKWPHPLLYCCFTKNDQQHFTIFEVKHWSQLPCFAHKQAATFQTNYGMIRAVKQRATQHIQTITSLKKDKCITYLSFEDLNKRVNETQFPSIWPPDLTVGVMPDRQEKYNAHVSQWSRSPWNTL